MVLAALLAVSTAAPMAAQTCSIVTPCALTYQLAPGGSQIQNVTVQVAAGVPWTVNIPTVYTQWLTVTPLAGTGPGLLSVQVNTTGLSLGAYLTLSFDVAGGGVTDRVQVTINVTSATTTSQIAANPSSLTFNYDPGGATPPTQLIVVSSLTGTPVNFTVSASSSGWLDVTPGSGNTLSLNQLTVSVRQSALLGLGVGSYDGSVVITPIGTTGATALNIPVRLNITGPPQLAVSVSSLAFAWQRGTATPASQSVTISAKNVTTPVFFTVSASYNPATLPWLVLPVSSSVTTTDLPVSINQSVLSTLASGTYKATVQVVSQTPGVQNASFDVTLRVSDTPLLTLSPASLQFTMSAGGALPAPQSVTVGSTSSSLAFSAAPATTSGGSWLTVTPSTGLTPAQVQISIGATAQSLLPGTYNGTVTVQTGTDTQQIAVTLTISSSAVLTPSPTSLTFLYQVGKSLPAPQYFNVTSSGAPMTFTVAATSTGNWLSIVNPPPTGYFTTPAQIGLQVTIGALTAGTYDGAVTLTPQGGGSVVTVPVKLIISTTPLLRVSVNELTYTYQAGGASPPQQFVAIESTSDPINFTVTSTTDSGANWLFVSPLNGTTPTNLTVLVFPASLPVGVYTGTVTVLPGNGAPTQTVRVRLTVNAGTLALSSSSLSFQQIAGGAAPAAQKVTVSNSAAGATPISFSATVATPTGNWLSVTPTSGTTPADLSVSVNGAGLQPGDYSGTITIQSFNASNSPQVINVALKILPALTITVTPSALTFNAQAPGAPPAAQTINITGSGQNMTFTATATTSSGGDWLALDQTAGTLPASPKVSIKADALGRLTPGNYQGTIRIEAPSTTNSPQTVTVTLVVTAQPPQVAKIVNSASYLPGAIAPGELLYIEGTAMGPSRLVSATPSPSFPVVLEEVRVLFDNIAAPLVYVSDTKITAVAPWGLAGRLSTQVVVEYKGQRSAPINMSVTSFAPGIYTAAASGVGQGAILNSDYSYNGVGTGRRPARKGESVMIYGTGGGATIPAGSDGVITPPILHPFPPSVSVSASVGGVPARVLYSGGAPGLISGAMQVNIEVPENAPSGPNVPIVLLIGGVPTQANVTMAIE